MIYHLKIALRTLIQGKLYTAISILGLALGIFCSLLVSTIVLDEFSYDKDWSRSANIFRLLSVMERGTETIDKTGAAYAGLAPELKRTFPEVEEYSELYVSPIDLKLTPESNQHINLKALYTDSAAQHLLDIELLQHQDLRPTKPVKKIIISEHVAKSYFPNTDPLGKEIYDLPRYESKANRYLVAGVMKDMPANTHLRADMVILKDRTEKALEKADHGMYVRHYLLLKSGTEPKAFEQKVNRWYRDYVTSKNPTRYELQPIQDAYLRSDFPAYQVHKGNLQQNYIFLAVAALLLLIACINFVNLSTARASSRLKETGVRKVLGASKATLIRQFLLESMLVFGVSTVLSLLLYTSALPFAEKFIEHPIAFTLSSNLGYFGAIWAIAFLISLLTGLYPAVFLSSFQTVNNNINNLLKTPRNKRSRLREALVVVQFSLSIVILIALFVMSKQINFMKDKDPGFDSKGLISIDHISFDEKSTAFKEALNVNPSIQSHSFSSWLPMDGAGYMTRYVEDPGNPGHKVEMWYIAGEPNLAETLGLRLKEGRFLSATRPSDAIEADNYDDESDAIRPAVLTASTAKRLHVAQLDQEMGKEKIVPVGIVEDFNSESLHKQLVPTVIVGYRNPQYGALLIRVQAGKEREVMQYVARVWKDLYPDKLLDMELMKDKLQAQYKAEERIEALFRAFSILTMFLAALGVFGLIVNTVSLRVKEIGIRKVMGASVLRIMTMLSKDFLKLTLLAALLASPLAWWAMHNWLDNFAYRIEINPWLFVAAGLIAVLIALLTVSIQALKAARANPVDSLRDE